MESMPDGGMDAGVSSLSTDDKELLEELEFLEDLEQVRNFELIQEL